MIVTSHRCRHSRCGETRKRVSHEPRCERAEVPFAERGIEPVVQRPGVDGQHGARAARLVGVRFAREPGHEFHRAETVTAGPVGTAVERGAMAEEGTHGGA